VKVPEQHAKALQTMFMEKLTAEEQEALNEYINIMKKKTPYWMA
jgi:hypothetical protein